MPSRRSFLQSIALLLSPIPALAKYFPTPKPIVLTPGITPERIKDAFDKMEARGNAAVFYLNPNSRKTLIRVTKTMGGGLFMEESRYNTRSKKSWSKGRDPNGSPGDMVCAGFFHTEGRAVMGYFWGTTVVADPDLPLNEFRLRSEREYVGHPPKNHWVDAPVEWVELSTQGFFHKTATFTRKIIDRRVVRFFVNEKIQEQFFET
jgi:hypothetical protein